MPTYNAIKGSEPYPFRYLSEFGVLRGMNGNFETNREYTGEELSRIISKLSAFHCAPIKLNKQWFCKSINCWRLVFEYDKTR